MDVISERRGWVIDRWESGEGWIIPDCFMGVVTLED
jgi:hypothetical protein